MELSDYTLTFSADPAKVLTSEMELNNFVLTLTAQLADFFEVSEDQVRAAHALRALNSPFGWQTCWRWNTAAVWAHTSTGAVPICG